MRRPSTYVVVALAAAVVGGIVALLAGALTGVTDNETKTVYVPTNASDHGAGREIPIARARPLFTT